MQNKTIWTSFAISLSGFWLLITPFTFAFHPIMLWSDLICGALLVFLGLESRKQKNILIPWIIGILGFWIQLAPLVFWAKEPASYLNNTLIGTLVIAFSLLIPQLPKQLSSEEPTIPPGWSYNPSSWPQRLPIALLVFLCWMISRYLAAFELGYIETVWDPFFPHGTERVLTSTISHDFPVPDAGLGALAYTLEFLSTCQGGKARWRTDPWLVLIFGILVIPVGLTSVTLVILQPLVVGTWCTLCLCTAVLMLTAIPFALDEVTAAIQYLRRSKEKPFFSLLFEGGLCPDAKKDDQEVFLDRPLSTLLKASLKGITFPWNLLLSACVGIVLMVLPWPFHIEGILEDMDPILGAFTIVVSMLSLSELARNFRWVNLFFAAVLAIFALISFERLSLSLIALHLIVAAALALLTFRKGHFVELKL